MSVAPLNQKIANRRAYRLESAVVIPAARPVAAPRTRAKSRQKAKANNAVLNAVAQSTGLAMLSAFVAFSVSSISGHVALEKVRIEGRNAGKLALNAQQAERGARARVEAMTSASSVEDWALAHGFIAPEAKAAPKAAPKVVD